MLSVDVDTSNCSLQEILEIYTKLRQRWNSCCTYGKWTAFIQFCWSLLDCSKCFLRYRPHSPIDTHIHRAFQGRSPTGPVEIMLQFWSGFASSLVGPQQRFKWSAHLAGFVTNYRFTWRFQYHESCCVWMDLIGSSPAPKQTKCGGAKLAAVSEVLLEGYRALVVLLFSFTWIAAIYSNWRGAAGPQPFCGSFSRCRSLQVVLLSLDKAFFLWYTITRQWINWCGGMWACPSMLQHADNKAGN